MSAYFLGSSLHTSLGAGRAAHCATLRQPPVAAGSVQALFAQRRQTLPYKLLADTPLDDSGERLDGVLDAVITQALDESELSAQERAALGLFIGTSSFDIAASESEYRAALEHDPAAIVMLNSSSLGNPAERIRARFGLRGPAYSFNTACTASANALLYADAMVRAGRLQHALVVGFEVFNSLTAMGFHGLQLLSSGLMKPFDRERNGLVLGEACAALVLGARQRNPNAFRLLGGANFCDTHSVSAANPDGSTVRLTLRQALDDAGVGVHEIAAIKTHGTASLLNDEAEAAGLRQVFPSMPPLVALKPFLGHTLGACGLNELLAFCAAAEEGFLFATPGIAADSGELGVALNQTPRDLPPGKFMLNYFGFGGNNTVLIVGNA